VNLPRVGRSRSDVLEALRSSTTGDAPWLEGKTLFLIYGVDEEHLQLLREAHSLFLGTNGLGAGWMFPSLAQLEAEVVSMTAALLGSESAVGNITSGGTESILMGVRAARERARAERPEVTAPEMVLPASAHPAFQKAGESFGIKSVRVPLTDEYVPDLEAVARAVNRNTIALVGSAPNYSFGTIDPVAGLARIALDHGIHFHVDACVGGFVLPFLRRLGEPVPPFDFTVPGVSTISADIHKYGFGARGTSVILYRTAELQQHARFVLGEWSGGPYQTATIAGSRPGGVVAAAWAVLNYLGEEGYLRLNREMLATTRALQAGIEQLPGFRILGKPPLYLFAFSPGDRDVGAVGDRLAQRGWFIHRQPTRPPSLHIVVTPTHTRVVSAFLGDLEDIARQVAPGRPVAAVASNYGTG